jgi:hypothetical protein
MEITEVEVSYSIPDSQQQQTDVPASCQTSVGGNVLVSPDSSVTCTFSFSYDGQENAYIWASAVTANGLTDQSDQVPIMLSDAGTVTPGAVAGCAVAQQSFQTGSPALVSPASLTPDSQVPPGSSSLQQLCDSAIYTYTAVFGPFSTCGRMQVGRSGSAAAGSRRCMQVSVLCILGAA